MEVDLVRRALTETGGNKTQAAKILGISREGLRKMLRRLNISA
jgi:DNA-binding protein Fis